MYITPQADVGCVCIQSHVVCLSFDSVTISAILSCYKYDQHKAVMAVHGLYVIS